MSDEERLDILERFLYLHEFTLHPNGRTHEGWLLAKENAEIEALEHARPILLEMIRAYAEQEIAGIGCVCGHVEPDPEIVTGAVGMTGEQLSREDWYYKGIKYARENPPLNPSDDSQFMKHVHALRHVLFVEIKDSFLKEIHARAIHAKYTGDQQYILLLYMQPDQATFLNLVTTGKNLLFKYGYGSDNNYGIVLEMVHQALDETFKEVHDG